MIGLYLDSSVSICPFPIAITRSISFDFVTLPNNRLFHSLIGFFKNSPRDRWSRSGAP
eukprot:COSAG01_NODE_33533_length_562_cov_2.449244_1_plen_57_part_10